jgi:hypothetical protein
VRLPHYGEENRAASRSWGSHVVNVLQRRLPDLPALLHGVPPPQNAVVSQRARMGS